MNEQHFGHKIRHLLNQGLALDARKVERLRMARERALQHHRPNAGGMLWADNVLGRFDGWGDLSLRVVLPLLILAGGVTALYVWEQNQRIAAIAEIDAQLLTDDLPVEAYVDRGFQNWLNSRRAAEQ